MSRGIDQLLARAAARLGVEPLTLNVGLFALAAGVLLNVALKLIFSRLSHTALLDLFGLGIGSDSWLPMRAAAEVINAKPNMPVYTTTVFGLHAKFQYPPTSLLLAYPIMVAEDLVGRTAAVFKVTCLGATFATAALMAWMFPRYLADSLKRGVSFAHRDRVALAGVAVVATLTFHPVLRALTLGQIQTWINLMFCAAAFAWIYGRKDWAGVLIAVTCLIKPQFALLVLWAAMRKEWRFVWYFAVPFGLVSLASVFVYGLEDYSDYFTLLSYVAHHGETFYANQSVNGLLNRLFHNGSNLEWDGLAYAPYNAWIYWTTTISSAAIIGLAILWRRGEHERASGLDFLIAALSFTVASPIAWTHHYGVMLPMFAIALPATLALPGRRGGALIVLAVAYVLSSGEMLVTNYLADTPLNVLQSYTFLGAVLMLVHLYRLRHALSQADHAPAAEVVDRNAAAMGA